MSDFPGHIGRTVAESTPWWPTPRDRNALPPNVITIVFDDTGWSDFGCFGSEIRTPHIDGLAKGGLRYTNFHVTPLCSPTRASFLTGRNHHTIGMRCLADNDTGFPNARGAVRADVPLLSDLLREEGYGTYMVGKWHLAPSQDLTPAGPHRNWPLARGFDRYYGFLGGCTDQYAPELIQDNHTIDPPRREGYHLSEDLADRTIAYLRDHAAFRTSAPFFLNLCFGATHAPIQVPRRYIDPYVPVFEKGWDRTREDRLARQKDLGLLPADTALVERNPEVPAWDGLGDDEKRLFTRLQAAFAGFLEHTDEQIGRVVAELRRLSLFDNTIILIFADNGASREGGRNGAVDCNAPYSGAPEPLEDMIERIDDIGGLNGPAHYPIGWAMAGNTPFRRYKQHVDLGGVRSPLVMSWPLGLPEEGAVRNQFLHVVDLAPTLMDLAGKRNAARFDGATFRATLASSTAPAPRSIQYWEMFGRRAIYADGWKALAEHEKGDDYGGDRWQLYDTRNDFSEREDVAALHPEKLRELQDIWWQEAEANSVLPLDDRTLVDVIRFRQPQGLISKMELTFYPEQGHIPQPSLVTSTNRSMDVTAHFPRGIGKAEGVLLSSGDDLGGYSLYVKGGQLHFVYRRYGRAFETSGPIPEETTSCTLQWRVDANDRVRATLLAGSRNIAQGNMGKAMGHVSFWGMDVGRDAARPVTDAYEAPFTFPAACLDRVEIRFLEEPDPKDLAAMGETQE